MYIHLKESTIKSSEVLAVTKNIIPATNFTPQYFAMAVYVKGINEPIVHTYEDEEERDEVFAELREALDECKQDNSEHTN